MNFFIAWLMFGLGFWAGLCWRRWVEARREAEEQAWAMRQFAERLEMRRN